MLFIFGDYSATLFANYKETFTLCLYPEIAIKDLVKSTNYTCSNIERALKNKNITCAIFMFGQVDADRIYADDVAPTNDSCMPAAATNKSMYCTSEEINKYVEWIYNLPGKYKKIIIGPCPYNLCRAEIQAMSAISAISESVVAATPNVVQQSPDMLSKQIKYYELLYQLKLPCTTKNNYYLKYVDVLDQYLDSQLNWRGQLLLPILISKLKDIGGLNIDVPSHTNTPQLIDIPLHTNEQKS